MRTPLFGGVWTFRDDDGSRIPWRFYCDAGHRSNGHSHYGAKRCWCGRRVSTAMTAESRVKNQRIFR